jgi:hypothetical protein
MEGDVRCKVVDVEVEKARWRAWVGGADRTKTPPVNER